MEPRFGFTSLSEGRTPQRHSNVLPPIGWGGEVLTCTFKLYTNYYFVLHVIQNVSLYVFDLNSPSYLYMYVYLSVIFDHDIAVVSVSNPENKRSYTVASTGPGEQIHRHVVPAQTHT